MNSPAFTTPVPTGRRAGCHYKWKRPSSEALCDLVLWACVKICCCAVTREDPGRRILSEWTEITEKLSSYFLLPHHKQCSVAESSWHASLLWCKILNPNWVNFLMKIVVIMSFFAWFKETMPLHSIFSQRLITISLLILWSGMHDNDEFCFWHQHLRICVCYLTL